MVANRDDVLRFPTDGARESARVCEGVRGSAKTSGGGPERNIMVDLRLGVWWSRGKSGIVSLCYSRRSARQSEKV